MRTKCFGALLWVLAWTTAVSAAGDAPVPARFHASIGGFTGTTYQYDLQGDSITCTKFAHGQRDLRVTTTVKPTEAQWREFRRSFDDLQIWRWQADYPNHNVADGTQWALEIAYADHSLKTRGDNNYPDASGKPNGDSQATKAFERYLAAVSKLTGKEFQ